MVIKNNTDVSMSTCSDYYVWQKSTDILYFRTSSSYVLR